MNFNELKPGHTPEGDEIKVYQSETKADKYIYLLAGVHGDEVEGVYVLDKLFSWFKEEDIELPLIIIPILNMDGYRAGTRVNSQGVDLNRNLPSSNWNANFSKEKYNPGKEPLSEPENQFLKKLFDKFPPRIIFSFHSWKPFININGDCMEVAEFLERYNSYDIVENIEDHPTPGSLGEFAPEKYQSPVLTLELPLINDDLGLNEIWLQNKAGLENLFKSKLI